MPQITNFGRPNKNPPVSNFAPTLNFIQKCKYFGALCANEKPFYRRLLQATRYP